MGAAAYATGPVMIRAALLGGMGAWSLLASRMVLGSLMMAAMIAVLVRRGSGDVRRLRARDVRDGLALGVFGYGLQLALFTLALERVSASLVVILFNAFPVFVVGIAAFTGRERLTARRAYAVGLSLVGVAIVATAGGDISAEPLGMLMAIASGLGYALMVLGGDALGRRIPPFQLTLLLTSGAALGFIAAMPLTGFGLPPTSGTLALTIAIAIAPSVIGTLAIVDGMSRIGPSLASILMMLEPPIAVLIAWIALGERLGVAQIFGGLLVLAAVALAQHHDPVREVELEIPR